MSAAKISVAKKAVKYIESKISRGTVLGIGTGSTVNFFIEELGNLKHHFKGVVSSSNASSEILINKGIEVFSLNDVNEVEFYIDGADEVTPENFLIKGPVLIPPQIAEGTLVVINNNGLLQALR